VGFITLFAKGAGSILGQFLVQFFTGPFAAFNIESIRGVCSDTTREKIEVETAPESILPPKGVNSKIYIGT
jgi:hypothetical protein